MSLIVETHPGGSLKFTDQRRQAQFELGVCMAIYKWDDLQTAVDNNWGGGDSADKRDWLVGSVVELFEGESVGAEDVEFRMRDILDSEFDVHYEEETTSATPISELIMKIYMQCAEDDFSVVKELYGQWVENENKRKQGLVKANVVTVVAQDAAEDENDNDEDEDEDNDDEIEDIYMDGGQSEESREPRGGPIVDDDGFELVQRRRR